MMNSILKFDADLSYRLRLDASQSGLRKAAIFLAHSGDSWFWAAGLGLIWLLTSGSWRQTAALMAIAVVVLALAVFAIKFSIRRRRPEGDWGSIYRSTDPHSFPSGHAARAFMLAVLGFGLGPAWLGWLLLIWAPLVCLARVSMGVHYLSDVAAGMVLGIVAGLFFLWITPNLMAWIPFLF